MNPWYAKAVMLAASVALVVIRAPHGSRSFKIKVVKHRNGKLETFLLTLAWIGYFVPLIWVVSSLFVFAEYPLHIAPLTAGCVCFILGLWLFHRSHVDLGTNWSITLEVREQHRLITNGVYRRIRHPMYTALLLYAFGQALVVPNWIAGPVYLVAFVILLALRLGVEERMMLDEFGGEYADYKSRTARLIPGVW